MSRAADIPTPAEPDGPIFTKAAAFDQEELLGARWWQTRLGKSAQGRSHGSRQQGEEMDRRGFLLIGGIVVGFAAIGGVVIALKGRDEPVTSEHDALQLQRDKGWNVQAAKVELQFPAASGRDAAGGTLRPDNLEGALRPQRFDLVPFYVPTLFQSLQQDSLRRVAVAIQTPAMKDAVAKGETVRRIFEQEPAQKATDVALVVDLDGPESVAFAAGLAPRFDAVFTFDNWPHPDGVVPSHLTLGAALFHRPDFERRAATAVRSPCFVLDRARLAAPVGGDRFDNRYAAKLPSAERLQSLGVKHVLYVVPAVAPPAELDDLNDVFVAWEKAGIDVRRLSLGDVAAWRPDAPDPGVPAGGGGRAPIYHSYGGRHWWFFHHYPYYGRVAQGPEPPPPPSSAAYRPSARPTMFTSRPVGGGSSGGSRSGSTSNFGRARYTSYPNRRPSGGSSWGRGGGGG